MKVLYIGQYDEGSTSKMRGECLKKLLVAAIVQVIDIRQPMLSVSRVWQSLGWRYKIGPYVRAINKYVLSKIEYDYYDLIWIDKAVFLSPKTIIFLRKFSSKMVHYTPDPAFLYHKSRYFDQTVKMFDVCITTKRFELDLYSKNEAKRVLLSTQGFDPELHCAYNSFESKVGVVFIGHFEPNRAFVLQGILDNNIPIKLAGIKWERFVAKNRNNNLLSFLGNSIYGENYAREISGSLISIGFLSRIIPELHTTRNFEIPACGTVMAVERNEETTSFFNEDEVIFYESDGDAITRIVSIYQDKDKLRQIGIKGSKRVHEGGYQYERIMNTLLKKIEIN